jgi:outer membrane protein assembly factor BamB
MLKRRIPLVSLFAILVTLIFLQSYPLYEVVSAAFAAEGNLIARVYLPLVVKVGSTPTKTPGNTPVPTPGPPSDWPQVQKDPQHTGFTSEVLGTNFKVKWTHPFQPERVYPQIQAIVAYGKVYVGTEMGHLYAFATSSGATTWQYPTSGSIGPILNSVAADSGKIYFGSMDGTVYALNASDGTLKWRNQLSTWLGFSTAPVVADGKVMLGGEDGNFYALDLNDGHVIWQYNVSAPILMTAAYDNQKVFFGTMDMYVYALNTSNGSLAWKSNKISGMAFKDYWPVVYKGYVIVIPLPRMQNDGIKPGFPFGWYTGATIPGGGMTDYQWLSKNGPTIAGGHATQVADFMNAQNTVINNYQANPQNFTPMINILAENTGQSAFAIPHFDVQAHNGAKPPPCVDRDGKIVIPVMFVKSGWGRIDLTTRRYVDVLFDNTNYNGGPIKTGDYPAGFGNGDENMTVSCTGSMILNFHYQEGNANYTGIFNLNTRTWTHIPQGWRNGQMFNNTQSGGGNPPTVSTGVIYHISFNELIARTTQ